jgi:hypothetical protein
MADIAELEKRITALEEQGKANEELKKRMAFLEQRYADHNTAFGKIVPIIEETRLRTSTIELSIDELKEDVASVKKDVASVNSRVGRVETQLNALRRDLPGMMAETMREVLKEQRGN